MLYKNKFYFNQDLVTLFMKKNDIIINKKLAIILNNNLVTTLNKKLTTTLLIANKS